MRKHTERLALESIIFKLPSKKLFIRLQPMHGYRQNMLSIGKSI